MRTEWFETKRGAEAALRALEQSKRKRGYREKLEFPLLAIVETQAEQVKRLTDQQPVKRRR